MNEMFSKIKKIKFTKKNVILFVIGFLALLIVVLGEFSSDSQENVSAENTAAYASQYTEKIEKKLETMLGSIYGAGKVSVMVTLESCYENVYATGGVVKNEQNENMLKTENQEEYIIIKNGSNNEECLIIKVYEPVVKGVAVVAEGADNASVKNAITQTVCALFDISSAKVSVEKMQKK